VKPVNKKARQRTVFATQEKGSPVERPDWKGENRIVWPKKQKRSGLVGAGTVAGEKNDKHTKFGAKSNCRGRADTSSRTASRREKVGGGGGYLDSKKKAIILFPKKGGLLADFLPNAQRYSLGSPARSSDAIAQIKNDFDSALSIRGWEIIARDKCPKEDVNFSGEEGSVTLRDQCLYNAIVRIFERPDR